MDIIKNLKKRYNNFIICMKYPFFWPRNVWTGKKCSGFFSYTLLDYLPKGWYKAFGLQMAEEIQKCINKLPKNERKQIKITQIKEKYGKLCIYTTYTFSELDKIIFKYERLSEITCNVCGKIATHISIGYILPYCHDCKLQNKKIKYKKITKSIRKIIKIYACE